MIVSIILLIILFAIDSYFVYEVMKDQEEIPTSLYYKKLSKLQRDIEKLAEKRKLLNPTKDGFYDKLENIEKEIKSKKKEIKLLLWFNEPYKKLQFHRLCKSL
ncbi:MAG: hypothetical protein ACI4TT_03815 [Christensenellales bacterium]